MVGWGRYGLAGLTLWAFIGAAGSAEAQGVHPNWVPLAKVEKRLRELNDFYGDISSALILAADYEL